MERGQVILCWTEFLTSIIDCIKDAKSCESEMLSYEKDKAVDAVLERAPQYINSEKPRLQTLGREAYIDALAHMARLPNVELSTWKVFFRKEEELAHHDIQSTIKDGLVFEDFHEKEEFV
ncbi:uncharacterized protein LOC128341574 isoform X2 [Hemicordylus capensis]|uniref:uncharacterized protein LOC128341574 isoform X2 n=1 Tax=Hemicordylus capensis TaxID=884348 RepID=UPI002302F6F8|nr:uncharacterized protein LOC128341574 isoform X2 [Hemicordylus capensis]